MGIASVSQMWNLRLALGIWLNITQSGIPSQLLIEDHDVATLLHFPNTLLHVWKCLELNDSILGTQGCDLNPASPT